ncbi:MAG TPA: DUF2147 domain-containing protein [Bacteroidales bacterium]|nr:DUF2147 domain-containing protein [Bacteroidales bacterium]
MKKATLFFLITTLIVVVNIDVLAQNNPPKADAVVGYYLAVDDEDNPNSQVRIFKAANGKYYGEIVWLKEPLEADGSEKFDTKNPDPKLHDRKILGLRILNDFVFDASDNEWTGGTIYSPKTGKTYRSYLRFDKENRLRVRGFVGVSLLGKTVFWEKEESRRK